MCVVPGGLMPYLQAGDIGISKSFKDLLSVEINTWKLSDKMEYTRFNNPRMSNVGTVCEWVRKAWRDTDEATVLRSVGAAGFASDSTDWFIAKHDVYGQKFNALWGSDDENLDEDTLNMQALDDDLDDIAVVDE
ncbi:hypothetical protein Pcac1_g644 [Phytophthora cactorum]|nr:hypothetical protein Pcac1_g644 [Phytophthora cactorum]KAG4045077.1 hypothetical protein PC123_g19514 [Phytophthora cactorum]